MVIMHVGAGGGGTETQRRDLIQRGGRQLVINTHQMRAAITQAEYWPRHTGAVAVRQASDRILLIEFTIDQTPGQLASGASRHFTVPNMTMLDLTHLVEIFRRVQQSVSTVCSIPSLMREFAFGVGSGSAQFGMLVQQVQLGIQGMGRRRRRFTAAQEHGVGQFRHAALGGVGRGHLFQPLELVLERRGARADDVLSRDRTGIGKGGAQAQAFDR